MGITDCDLLLSFGARFDDRVTGDVENFAPNAKIVHFDIDKVEINKIVHADISVNGDLRWSLPLFIKKMKALDEKSLQAQYGSCARRYFSTKDSIPLPQCPKKASLHQKHSLTLPKPIPMRIQSS